MLVIYNIHDIMNYAIIFEIIVPLVSSFTWLYEKPSLKDLQPTKIDHVTFFLVVTWQWLTFKVSTEDRRITGYYVEFNRYL